MDVLDSKVLQHKKLWSIRLLIIGGAMIALTLLASSFWTELGLGRNEAILLALSLMVSFGINLAGFIIGFLDRKRNKKRALFGIIGNLLCILFFIFVVASSIMAMSTTP